MISLKKENVPAVWAFRNFETHPLSLGMFGSKVMISRDFIILANLGAERLARKVHSSWTFPELYLSDYSFCHMSV